MAHGRQEFVLVGFTEYLERRPLKFVEPIPSAIICSACNQIPRVTYTLLCGHAFCEPCYESSATTSECVCPLDGDASDTADVTRKRYPAENLLRRKVHCWNEANGCGAILPASQVAEHVRQDCQHHVTHCSTCLAVVLSRDVCAHLKSRCTELVLHEAPEPQQGTENNETTQLVAFERKVEQRVRELDDKLAQLSSESSSQNDKLIEISHAINHLKEAITEQFAPGLVQALDRLDRNESEIKALLACEKTVEQRVGELDTKLAQLSLESASQKDKLIELCRNNINLKEALTQQLRTVSVQTIDRLERNEADMKALLACEKTMEQRVSELDTKLAQLSLESGSQSDKLIDVCSNINHLKEASDRNVAEIKALYTEQGESLKSVMTSVLTSVPSDPKTHQWVVTGYSALKVKAMKAGCYTSMSDKVYLRRYLMSWGIYFKKEGDIVYLFLRIQMHEGREDDFLDWPFLKEMKLSIIHPDTRQELYLCGKGDSSEANKECFSRPIGGSNTPGHFGGNRVESSDIERDGYVKRDQLLLRFEVL